MAALVPGGRLLVASHNRGKVAEIAELLAPYGVDVVSAADIDLPAPEETAGTFAGNARIKAHAAARASGLPALADDSGLSVDALGGAPGVDTADWAETPQGRDFALAMARIRSELVRTKAAEPYGAAFICLLCLAFPDGREQIFEGRVAGRIVWPMRGTLGHGYDPIFQPEGSDLTFAEMDRDQKNRISHRGRAFEKFMAACLG